MSMSTPRAQIHPGQASPDSPMAWRDYLADAEQAGADGIHDIFGTDSSSPYPPSLPVTPLTDMTATSFSAAPTYTRPSRAAEPPGMAAAYYLNELSLQAHQEALDMLLALQLESNKVELARARGSPLPATPLTDHVGELDIGPATRKLAELKRKSALIQSMTTDPPQPTQAAQPSTVLQAHRPRHPSPLKNHIELPPDDSIQTPPPVVEADQIPSVSGDCEFDWLNGFDLDDATGLNYHASEVEK